MLVLAFLFTALSAWNEESSFNSSVQSIVIAGSSSLFNSVRSKAKGEEGDLEDLARKNLMHSLKAKRITRVFKGENESQ